MAARQNPKHLYKFLASVHADTMLDRGTVKIGTAAEFRISDGKDAGRSDPKELVTAWQPGECVQEIDSSHPFVKSLCGSEGPPWKGETRQVRFTADAQLINYTSAYMYCTSSVVTPNLRKRMLFEFGADACIRIDDIAEFANALTARQFFHGRLTKSLERSHPKTPTKSSGE